MPAPEWVAEGSIREGEQCSSPHLFLEHFTRFFTEECAEKLDYFKHEVPTLF
jgi:hypothetical protein